MKYINTIICLFLFTVSVYAQRIRPRWGEKPEITISKMDKKIAENPKDGVAYLTRSNAYFNLKDFDQALLDIEAAISIYPENYQFKYQANKIEILTRLERNEEAIDEIDKLLNRMHAEPIPGYNYYYHINGLYSQKGCLLVKMGRYSEALMTIKKLEDTRPEYDPKSEYLKCKETALANLSNSQGGISDTSPPTIEITEPTTRGTSITSNASKVTIKGNCTDESGVKQVRVNGAYAQIAVGSTSVSFSISIDLVQGQNTFWVEGTDTKGNVGKKDFTITYNASISSSNNQYNTGKNYLLVIGIDDYADNTTYRDLKNAVKDCQDIKNLLVFKYQFNSENVTILTNGQATESRISATLNQLQSTLTEKDNLLIYFAGHGNMNGNVGYWLVNGANGSNTNFSNSELKDYVTGFKAKHTFVIADACFSGSLLSSDNRGESKYITELDKFKSRWALASGRKEVVSDGQAGTNSPFAKSILTFLTNSTETFAAHELVDYVKRQVANNTSQTPVGGILYGTGDELGEFIFRQK